jgi:dipeptidyl aminopeptidase/acylaminoacyl peptidase
MSRLGLAAIVLVAASLAGCKPAPKATSALPPQEAPPLIARADLFGNPERTQARISPDGANVAFLAPKDGYLNIFVMRTGADFASARALTADVKRGVRQYAWAKNSAQILFLQDEAGDENWRVYAVDIAAGKTTDLTPLSGVRARIVGLSPRKPNVALIGINDRDPKWHDVYEVDLRTGARKLVLRNTQRFGDVFADLDNAVRLAKRSNANGDVELWGVDAAGAWRKTGDIPFADAQTTEPIGFEGDGKSYLMFDSTNRDKSALVRVDAATGAKTVLGESQRADVSDVWLDPISQTPEAFAASYLKREWTGLDEAATADIDFLRANLKGEASVVSRSDDDAKWIVVEDGPTAPASTYLYDRTAKRLKRLFENRPALSKAPLTPMIPVEIPARDGLTLVSYLTLPPGADVDGNGRPERPLPMVLVVHGGPWARDEYGSNSVHQWLVNRGYVALSVNYRGSTGFGKAFVNAGNREWAGKMHDDLIDAVEWAQEQGIAARNKSAIFGGSYGGYATLVGLTFTPATFACGVSIVGPSNLETLLASIPPYWESVRADLFARVGDPRTPEGRKLLADRSPLHKAADITRPLLIGQGANDPRVKQAESDQIVAAMEAKKIPVTYVLYPDEGHGFARPQNRMSFFAVSEAFLARCLGGRVQPIGADFEGASLNVRAGADLVPGLAASLAARAPATSSDASPAAVKSTPPAAKPTIAP